MASSAGNPSPLAHAQPSHPRTTMSMSGASRSPWSPPGASSPWSPAGAAGPARTFSAPPLVLPSVALPGTQDGGEGAPRPYYYHPSVTVPWVFTPPMPSTGFADLFAAIKDLTVDTLPVTQEVVSAPELWAPNGAVIMVLRRVGWSLCKDTAQELAKLKPELDALGIRLIAIVKSEVGIDEFVTRYWPGELFLDRALRWFKANGAGRISVISGYYSSYFGATKQLLADTTARGIPCDNVGEGFKLGGVIVVGPGATHGGAVGSPPVGVLFHHREVRFGLRPENKDVMKAVNCIREALGPAATHASSNTPMRQPSGGKSKSASSTPNRKASVPPSSTTKQPSPPASKQPSPPPSNQPSFSSPKQTAFTAAKQNSPTSSKQNSPTSSKQPSPPSSFNTPSKRSEKREMVTLL